MTFLLICEDLLRDDPILGNRAFTGAPISLSGPSWLYVVTVVSSIAGKGEDGIHSELELELPGELDLLNNRKNIEFISQQLFFQKRVSENIVYISINNCSIAPNKQETLFKETPF